MMRRLGLVVLLLLAGCGGGNSASGSGGSGGSSGSGGSGNGGSAGTGAGGTSGHSCNAQNCAGCCFNGACQAGISNAACGKDGVACRSCPSWQTCSPQQTCSVDPNSTWNVVAVSTSLPTTDPSGAEWDAFGGAPDPYARCQINGVTVGTTSTVSNSFSATWNQVVCPSVKASVLMTGQVWSLCVWDADVSSDDLAGCWPRIMQQSDFGGQPLTDGLVANSKDTGGKLVLKLVKQ